MVNINYYFLLAAQILRYKRVSSYFSAPHCYFGSIQVTFELMCETDKMFQKSRINLNFPISALPSINNISFIMLNYTFLEHVNEEL